jgi:hypothetical protein
MDADLDLLLTTVFVTADDLLPVPAASVRRRVSDAEIITLCVAQAMLGIPSDERFLKRATKTLRHLFPQLPKQPGFHKRRVRLTEQIERVMHAFAVQSPGYYDDLLLVDSTPIECARSRETVKRAGQGRLADHVADAADYGYCASHSRFFWGFRLHGLFAPDGTPIQLRLTSPKTGERIVCLDMLHALDRPVTVLGDKGYAGREFEAQARDLGAEIVRPRRKDEPGQGPHLAPIRQRIESIFWTCKDLLTLERHGARTLKNLRARICSRFLALTAAITLNHQLGRPPRALIDYTA